MDLNMLVSIFATFPCNFAWMKTYQHNPSQALGRSPCRTAVRGRSHRAGQCLGTVAGASRLTAVALKESPWQKKVYFGPTRQNLKLKRCADCCCNRTSAMLSSPASSSSWMLALLAVRDLQSRTVVDVVRSSGAVDTSRMMEQPGKVGPSRWMWEGRSALDSKFPSMDRA